MLEKAEIFHLVGSINAWLQDGAYSEPELAKVFELLWPELDRDLQAAINVPDWNAPEEDEDPRTEKDILEELVASIDAWRQLSNGLSPILGPNPLP